MIFFCISYFRKVVFAIHIHDSFIIKSNQMSLPNVPFAVKTTSVTPPSITGRYQCITQADRDVGYREWFKTVPAIYHEINMNERKKILQLIQLIKIIYTK